MKKIFYKIIKINPNKMMKNVLFIHKIIQNKNNKYINKRKIKILKINSKK